MWPFKKKTQVVEALIEMHKGFSRYGWNRKYYAAKKYQGDVLAVPWCSEAAESYCVMGMAYSIIYKSKTTTALESMTAQGVSTALNDAVKALGHNTDVFVYNDTIAQNKGDIKKLIKKAVQLEEAK